MNRLIVQAAGKLLGSVLLLGLAVPVRAATVEYIHTDALGSPVAVTNSAGVVIERREYEPYGRQLAPTTVADGPGYTGHVSDAATGLDYMQQRYYDPGIGRFLSADPVNASSRSGANFNRYQYANNSPYKFVDPDGRLSRKRDPRSLNSHTSNLGGVGTVGQGFNSTTTQQPKESNAGNQQLLVNHAVSENGGQAEATNQCGWSNVGKDEAKNLGETFLQLAEAKRLGTGFIGNLITAKQLADLSASEATLTMRWAVYDVGFYRQTDGIHYPYMQGSLINWQLVEWRDYDPGSQYTPAQVVGRFLRVISHEDP